MKENEFECAVCHGVFEKDWSDEESIAEGIKNFGRDISKDTNVCTICDDCYDNLMESKN
jgi:hypothetical protein